MRRWILGSAIVATCTSAVGHAQEIDFAKQNKFFKIYQDCVILHALRLSSGTDSAPIVADGATTLCKGSMRDLASTFPKGDLHALTEFIKDVKKDAVDAAVLQILEQRAK